MKSWKVLTILGCGINGLTGATSGQVGETGQNAAEPYAAAWEAWQKGEIGLAARLAGDRKSPGGMTDKGRHLRFLTAYVSGDYEDALAHYKQIGIDYERRSDLKQPVLDGLLHLGRYADAESFAREHKMPEWRVEQLGRLREHPLKASLTELTVIPYAAHPLADYFPAFPAELNATELTVHVDTGGTFLIMGKDRAKRLGIEIKTAGKGYHGATPVDMFVGLADSFRLGDAELKNVPVAVLASLSGPQDFVIFGTNVLQQFLSTLDYPNRRLILSPRGDAAQRTRHLAMLPKQRTRVPFYMWGDHYMFARGAVGRHKGLNFFIDSGLVSLHPGGAGGMRQAAFTTSMANLTAWGFAEDDLAKGVVESHLPVALGPLAQTNLLIVPGKVGTTPFGGVQMHGLLSHAFLKRYTWTLDFVKREYVFSGDSR